MLIEFCQFNTNLDKSEKRESQLKKHLIKIACRQVHGGGASLINDWCGEEGPVHCGWYHTWTDGAMLYKKAG